MLEELYSLSFNELRNKTRQGEGLRVVLEEEEEDGQLVGADRLVEDGLGEGRAELQGPLKDGNVALGGRDLKDGGGPSTASAKEEFEPG